jgi:hypothetical protein
VTENINELNNKPNKVNNDIEELKKSKRKRTRII